MCIRDSNKCAAYNGHILRMKIVAFFKPAPIDDRDLKGAEVSSAHRQAQRAWRIAASLRPIRNLDAVHPAPIAARERSGHLCMFYAGQSAEPGKALVIPCGQLRRSIVPRDGQMDVAVSYTHLDVYKRQVWMKPKRVEVTQAACQKPEPGFFFRCSRRQGTSPNRAMT